MDLVPVRGEAAVLGWQVSYDAADHRIDLRKGDAQAALWLGSQTEFRSGQRYQAIQPVQSLDGCAYMSLHDLDQLLGESGAGLTASTPAIRQQIVAASAQYSALPYTWGGSTPATGFDCSGFVWWLYRTHGLALPRTTSAVLFTMGTPVDRNHLQPGDLIFYAIHQPGVVTHVGIYLGGDRFISATTPYGIYATSMDKPYWVPKYMGARRI